MFGPGKFVDPDDVGEEMAHTGGQSGGVWLPEGYVALGAYQPLSSELSIGTDITTDHVPQTEKFGASTNVVGDAWEFIEHHLSGSWDWSNFSQSAYVQGSEAISGHTIQGTGNSASTRTKTASQTVSIYDSLPMNEVDFVKRSRYNNMFLQVFEIPTESGELVKLDIIDVPEYTSVTRADGSTTKRKVAFVGKVFTDTYGMPNFVNIFTLVFTKDET
jgi:hypothetical protein